MNVIITGANGFVGSNLRWRINELGFANVVCVDRSTPPEERADSYCNADAIVHLAGVNRPQHDAEFEDGNGGTMRELVNVLEKAGRSPLVVFASSIQAEIDNAYGRSKRSAEDSLLAFGRSTGSRVRILRLPNVFGKWSKPNYNSAVATFCFNLTHDLPVVVHDPSSPLRLVYIDDVVAQIISILRDDSDPVEFPEVGTVYSTDVGAVERTLRGFLETRLSNTIANVGTGLDRALYATFVSFLDPTSFSYPLVQHSDPRGSFSEVLKTRESGQFSFFTAFPGVTRGGHYHHTKTEKFVVLSGTARFGFRHIVTGATHEIITSGEKPVVVETIPGWTHDITNISELEMIVMLWANEVFEPERPDTIAMPVRTT